MQATQAVSGAKTGRGYSTRFEDHKGLIFRLARQCHARLRSGKITAMEFEDVHSEMCVAYTRAAKGYDASLGITFTAYLGRSCYNHFNKIAERLELEQFGRKIDHRTKARKATAEMSAEELEEFERECDGAAEKPKSAAAAIDDKTRHFGLGLTSLDAVLRETGSGMLEILEVEDESRVDGLTTAEEALHVRQVLTKLRADATLLPETRAYVLHLLGAPLSAVGRERIQDASSRIRSELRTRYGVSVNAIRV